MTDARYSHGMILRHRVRNVGTWNRVGHIYDQQVPNPSREKILTTEHESQFETSIPGRVTTHSAVVFMVNWLPSANDVQLQVQSGLDADDGDGRIDGWEVETPDGQYWRFEGFLIRQDIVTEEDDRITSEMEICVTGSVTEGTKIDYSDAVSLSTTSPIMDTLLVASVSPAPDGDITWQWQQRDDADSDWADIEGATAANFTPDWGYLKNLSIDNPGAGYSDIRVLPPTPVSTLAAANLRVTSTVEWELVSGALDSVTFTERGRGYAAPVTIDVLAVGGNPTTEAEVSVEVGNELGTQLRVAATFEDALGDEITVYSPATDEVTAT